MFRRKFSAVVAIGLLAVGMTVAGCTSQPLTDARQIVDKGKASYDRMTSVHFRLEAVGQALYGFDTVVESPSPEPTGSAAASPSDSPAASPSDSPAASPSDSPAASPSGSASATASPAPSASASASAAATGSAAASTSPLASASPSPSATPAPSPTPMPSKVIDLSGAYAEGDLDIANGNARLVGNVPALPGFSGEMIVIGAYDFIRHPGDAKYVGGGISELAIAPLDSTSQEGAVSMIGSVVAIAADKSLQPRLIGTEDVLGDACYHITVTVTPEVVNQKLGLGGTSLGNGTIDLWITHDGFNVRVIEFRSSDATAGSVAIRLTLSNFNNVEPISGPDPANFEIPALQSVAGN